MKTYKNITESSHILLRKGKKEKVNIINMHPSFLTQAKTVTVIQQQTLNPKYPCPNVIQKVSDLAVSISLIPKIDDNIALIPYSSDNVLIDTIKLSGRADTLFVKKGNKSTQGDHTISDVFIKKYQKTMCRGNTISDCLKMYSTMASTLQEAEKKYTPNEDTSKKQKLYENHLAIDEEVIDPQTKLMAKNVSKAMKGAPLALIDIIESSTKNTTNQSVVLFNNYIKEEKFSSNEGIEQIELNILDATLYQKECLRHNQVMTKTAEIIGKAQCALDYSFDMRTWRKILQNIILEFNNAYSCSRVATVFNDSKPVGKGEKNIKSNLKKYTDPSPDVQKILKPMNIIDHIALIKSSQDHESFMKSVAIMVNEMIPKLREHKLYFKDQNDLLKKFKQNAKINDPNVAVQKFINKEFDKISAELLNIHTLTQKLCSNWQQLLEQQLDVESLVISMVDEVKDVVKMEVEKIENRLQKMHIFFAKKEEVIGPHTELQQRYDDLYKRIQDFFIKLNEDTDPMTFCDKILVTIPDIHEEIVESQQAVTEII